MKRIFNDLHDARQIMVDNVIPNLIERGNKLTVLDDSVSTLVEQATAYHINSARLNARNDRIKMATGLICLLLCLLTVAWYFLSARITSGDAISGPNASR